MRIIAWLATVRGIVVWNSNTKLLYSRDSFRIVKQMQQNTLKQKRSRRRFRVGFSNQLQPRWWVRLPRSVINFNLKIKILNASIKGCTERMSGLSRSDFEQQDFFLYESSQTQEVSGGVKNSKSSGTSFLISPLQKDDTNCVPYVINVDVLIRFLLTDFVMFKLLLLSFLMTM